MPRLEAFVACDADAYLSEGHRPRLRRLVLEELCDSDLDPTHELERQLTHLELRRHHHALWDNTTQPVNFTAYPPHMMPLEQLQITTASWKLNSGLLPWLLPYAAPSLRELYLAGVTERNVATALQIGLNALV